jgi:uncharacterized protein (TIGR02118 family)
MVKLIVTMKRKPGTTQEEFDHYWKEKHAPTVLRIVPGLVRYVQNHLVKLNDKEAPYDGIAELYFQDVEAFRNMSKWYRSEPGKELRDDEARFLDPTRLISFVSEEVVIK